MSLQADSQSVLSTCMVECGISMLGIIIMIWVSIPDSCIQDTLGLALLPGLRRRHLQRAEERTDRIHPSAQFGATWKKNIP